MMIKSLTCAFMALFSCAVENCIAAEFPEFSATQCERRIDAPDINAIMKDVFLQKFEELADAKVLPDDFRRRNEGLGFAICDNESSYDTFVVYGKGVVFDYQMIVYLFAQSRALIVGRYISLDHQFDVYRDVVDAFVQKTTTSGIQPLAVIESSALGLGMDHAKYAATTSEENFSKREQTLFIQSLYFLAMHERCHVSLDHESRLKVINSGPASDRPKKLQQLELEADNCALEVINSDEAHFRSSPISFFGVMMTIATQEIVAKRSTTEDEADHPPTTERLNNARDQVMAFLHRGGAEVEARYGPTIMGTTEVFDKLLSSELDKH